MGFRSADHRNVLEQPLGGEVPREVQTVIPGALQDGAKKVTAISVTPRLTSSVSRPVHGMLVVTHGVAGRATGGGMPQAEPMQAYSALNVEATSCSMFTGLVKKVRAQ